MSWFVPQFEGALAMDRVPDDFVQRIKRRVEEGLFVPGNRSRADYRVRTETRDTIDFGAEGLLTAYAIGLNEVHVERGSARTIHYRVTYWRWTWTAVAHAALLGLVLVSAYLLWPSMRQSVEAVAGGRRLFLGIICFFCLLWPWILAALHRGPADRALRRVLTEALAAEPNRATGS